MIPCMIDTMEVQDVATGDISESFLQNDYNKGDILINMEGDIVNILKDINPSYCKYCIYIYIREKKCMYVEYKKAVYWTLEASLLF